MTAHMRTAVYYSNSDIRIENRSVPRIRAGEILMRVEASGICGSDVMEWYRIHKVPLVLGHEVAGTVYKKGRGVRGFKIGDRIAATHHVPCGTCAYCRDGHETVCETLRRTHFEPGGFAEFVRLPAINVLKGTLKLPPKVSFEEGSFIEPLGCVVRGQRLAGVKKGQAVLVVGSGLSGLLHIKMARHLGARRIFATDIDPYRLKMARRAGAHFAIKSTDQLPVRIMAANRGRLADRVILCAGARPAIAQGLRSVERGGTVLLFTAAGKDEPLPVSANDIFWRSEVRVLSSYAASPADLKQALSLIARRKVKVKDMITHRLGLRHTQKGFGLVVRPKRSLKVIIEPQR